MSEFLMGCGHVANATKEGDPVCVICYGIIPGADNVVDMPDFNYRIAKCTYCRKEATSNSKLPFFGYDPEKVYDSYYCGCKGWD
ncbi:MAG TPA: hypothetical protein VLG09_02605 [Candidatus Saccharimonadales bacterium]|nr:hypothetical protein [Candidatus Saccharimonadales bacterium]